MLIPIHNEDPIVSQMINFLREKRRNLQRLKKDNCLRSPFSNFFEKKQIGYQQDIKIEKLNSKQLYDGVDGK